MSLTPPTSATLMGRCLDTSAVQGSLYRQDGSSGEVVCTRLLPGLAWDGLAEGLGHA